MPLGNTLDPLEKNLFWHSIALDPPVERIELGEERSVLVLRRGCAKSDHQSPAHTEQEQCSGDGENPAECRGGIEKRREHGSLRNVEILAIIGEESNFCHTFGA